MEQSENPDPLSKKAAQAIRDAVLVDSFKNPDKIVVDDDMSSLLAADEQGEDGEDAKAIFEDDMAKKLKEAMADKDTIPTYPAFHQHRYKYPLGKKKIIAPPKKNRPQPPTMDKLLRIYDHLGSLGFKDEEKALFAASYLSAARIGETTGLRRGDLTTSSEIKDGKELLFLEFNLRTQKQRGNVGLRNVCVPIFGQEERMAKDLMAFVAPLSESADILTLGHYNDNGAGDCNYDTPYEGSTISVLQKLRERKAYQILHQIDWGPMGMVDTTGRSISVPHWKGTTHFLRHIRLTHLHTIYKFTIPMIQQVAGWSSPAMSSNYIHVGADEQKRYFLDKVI